jgi:hypothetical protein
MHLSYETHIGILLENLYSRKPCTAADIAEAEIYYQGQPNYESVISAINLVRLTTEDELVGRNCPKKLYVITRRAKEVIDAIKVNRQLPIERILALLKQPRCLCLSPEIAYFVWAEAGCVRVIYFQQYTDAGGAMKVGSSSFDLGKVYEFLAVFRDSEEERPILTAYQEQIETVLRTLIFLDLTNPEITIVAPGKKHSQRPIGYTNSSKQRISIVDSTWNKYIVRVEGFGVRGHFRVQPCGVGYQDLKLIWINSYQKEGYVRKPKAGKSTT